MSRFIDLREQGILLPPDCRIACLGDTHVGAHTFHEPAFLRVVAYIASQADMWWLHMGDVGEGKRIDSKHYNPSALHPRRLTPKRQLDAYAEMVAPIAPKLLAQVQGNHDRYLSREFDVIEYLVQRLEVQRAYGHPQTWLQVSPDLCLHLFHGRRMMPRGAKDPVQRRGNQLAWLKRELEPLAHSCHVQLMGHTHYLLSLGPIEQYGLLNDEAGTKNVRAAFFVEPHAIVHTSHGDMPFVPERARFYGNTGTFRRSGSFDADFDADYAEEAGYPPSPIGYLILHIRNNKAVALEEVIAT